MLQLSDSIRAFAAMLYDDLADIQRACSEILPNGSTVQRFATVQSALPCRLSRVASRRDDLKSQLPQTEINCEARLYCDPFCDVRPGDMITVFRSGQKDRSWQFSAGDPFVYPSHMEIPLVRTAEA